MKANQNRQYTIRNLPPQIDQELRKRARKTRKSLNQITIEALARGTDLSESPTLYNDLDHLAGTWQEDPQFDQALEMQRRIDVSLWS